MITHKHRSVPDYPALVDCYSRYDLASPFRSTVPLLAYWKDAERRLPEFGEATGTAWVGPVALGFEYTVPVRLGKGKESHTDLMLLTRARTVAIEAKYTEPMYESVRAWLGDPWEANKQAVIGGWLSAINDATGSELQIEGVLDCTYQMVHRTASACVAGPESRAVVYLLFNQHEVQVDEYVKCLESLARCIARPNQIDFWIYSVPLIAKREQKELQERWRGGERDLSDAVREGLLTGALMDFGEPIVRQV